MKGFYKMKTTEKKTETLTIRITGELAQMLQKCAEHERRPVGQMVALWVEDVASVEILKATDKGTTYSRPTFRGSPNVL